VLSNGSVRGILEVPRQRVDGALPGSDVSEHGRKEHASAGLMGARVWVLGLKDGV
jgi:hypothetical protein